MHVRFDVSAGVQIGERSVVNDRCRLDGRGGLKIGNDVAIAAETTILTADHDVRKPGFPFRARPVFIEDSVFVGTRCLILPGVTIGKGAVVAAGATVTRDVADYAIVAGVPARTIGERPSAALDYTLSYYPLLR